MGEEESQTDRGGGLHVQGGLRIRNLTLSFDEKTGDLTDTSMITELRADTFHHWLKIAEEASSDAEAARRIAVDANADDDEAFNSGLEAEFQASMVAIAAAAFAIDAFYSSVIEHAPSARVPANSRPASIIETLKLAFSLSGTQQDALHEPIRTLFRLRDQAVHPPAAWVKPALHPAFNLGMEPRFVNYRVENAINAQLLARKLISTCLQRPKPGHSDLAEWCQGLQEMIPEPPPVPDWVNPEAPPS